MQATTAIEPAVTGAVAPLGPLPFGGTIPHPDMLVLFGARVVATEALDRIRTLRDATPDAAPDEEFDEILAARCSSL